MGARDITPGPGVAFSLHGTAIGRGVAIGRARVLQAHGHDIDRYHVEADRVEAEVARLRTAINEIRAELVALATDLPAAAPAEAQALLDVHVLLLDDPMFGGQAERLVREERRNAEWALWTQADDLSDQFQALDDPYLRERGRDVRQVADRVLRVLSGDARPRGGAPVADEPIVLVADDIAPADLLHWRGAQAFCIDQGGVVSHSAILARSSGRPAVIGLGRASELVRDGDLVIVDGDHGALVVCPDAATLADYVRRRDAAQVAFAALKRLAAVRARTRDGVDVTLQANIELPGEAAAALELGAEGVGLMRSEFLFLGRETPPDEEEQYLAYRDAVLGMAGRPVTIRTLDVGADKALPEGSPLASAPSENPALGERAIRFCLAHPRLFLAQLRAILRASAHGPVKLLLPLVTADAEIDATLRLLSAARAQLQGEGHAFSADVPVGAMVEVPATAIMAPWFARRLDFLSIGTNDLIQYTLAIDRTDDAVADLYDPLHPAVLRLIAHTLAAGRRAGIPVSVCGEMAGDPALAPLLLGLGLRDFSMNPSQLLQVKEAILSADAEKSRLVARQALRGFAGG